jgi:hypothetical protein
MVRRKCIFLSLFTGWNGFNWSLSLQRLGLYEARHTFITWNRRLCSLHSRLYSKFYFKWQHIIFSLDSSPLISRNSNQRLPNISAGVNGKGNIEHPKIFTNALTRNTIRTSQEPRASQSLAAGPNNQTVHWSISLQVCVEGKEKWQGLVNTQNNFGIS